MKQVFIILTLLSFHLNAQYETINWNIAGTAILNFTSTPAIVSNTFPIINGAQNGTSVSDAFGNLKIVTRADHIYNAQGQLVAPQSTVVIVGGEQSGLVVPMPGNPGVYYVFFVRGYNSVGGLSYSVFNPASSKICCAFSVPHVLIVLPPHSTTLVIYLSSPAPLM